MMKERAASLICRIFIPVLLLLQAVAGSLPVYAAATLLPNGQQCFQATSPTSGGLSGPITTLGTITGGSGYVSAIYPNVPLTGGSGFGATATVTVAGGSVTGISITNPGSHYSSADTLSAAAANLGGSGSGFSVPVTAVSTTGTGMLGLLGTITGGSGGTAGTYAGVALTGGAGSGATANITVSGGAVTAVAILNPGSGYAVADTLSAASGNIGGVTGFSVPVSSVAINQSLAGGSVAMYIPQTNTLKQTWQNAAQTVLNTNPITLDQNGCATIYGAGSYRQVLMDALGDIVWDKITTDTSAQQNTFWAGTASGTSNGIILTDPGFNGTDGSIINFFPISTNTSATTVSIASTGFSNISIVKDTTAGPLSLTGGEITAPASGTPDVVSVIYSAVQNNFHILNPVIQSASGSTAPLCGTIGLFITVNVQGGSTLTVLADQVVMQSPSGLTIQRGTVSLPNVNVTVGNSTSTINGMDGEAPGTNNWLYVWLIDNGSAPQGLLSLASGNGGAPIMPSGYTYKCRVGAVRMNATGGLLQTRQNGPDAVWVPNGGVPNPIITSSAGSYWTSQSISAVIPPTALKMTVAAEMQIIQSSGGAFSGSVGVAPDSLYGTPGSSGRPPCSFIMPNQTQNGVGESAAGGTSLMCDFVLESTSVIYTGSTASNAGASLTLSAVGWKDRGNDN